MAVAKGAGWPNPRAPRAVGTAGAQCKAGVSAIQALAPGRPVSAIRTLAAALAILQGGACAATLSALALGAWAISALTERLALVEAAISARIGCSGRIASASPAGLVAVGLPGGLTVGLASNLPLARLAGR